MTSIYIFGSVALVSLLSLIGVFALSVRDDLLKKMVFGLVSLAAGALIGDAFLHALPEALEEVGDPLMVSFLALLGIITFFTLEKVLRWHHHHGGLSETHEELPECESGTSHTHTSLGALVIFGDGLHNFIDGIVIAASFLVNPAVGIAATVAVILHEIPQEIGDFGILLHAGYSKTKALFANFVSGLGAVLGAALVLFVPQIESAAPLLVAFAAGSFIYIATADLVPELHKTTHPGRSFLQLLGIILGIVAMGLLLFLE